MLRFVSKAWLSACSTSEISGIRDRHALYGSTSGCLIWGPEECNVPIGGGGVDDFFYVLFFSASVGKNFYGCAFLFRQDFSEYQLNRSRAWRANPEEIWADDQTQLAKRRRAKTASREKATKKS